MISYSSKKKWIIIVIAVVVIVLLFVINYRRLLNEDIVFGTKFEIDSLQNVEQQEIEEQSPVIVYKRYGNLVNILEKDDSFLVDLKYATTDNFMGVVMYGNVDGAYLQMEVAQMLAEAHSFLKSINAELRILIYDAVRPLTVQQKMWDHVKGTPYHRYVAPPERLSLHNFGAAVDLTLADWHGTPLDMGTPFDFFGRAAGITDEQLLIEQGVLNRQQVKNRQLLRQVMHHAGFRSISGEWWHFNACSLREAKQKYTLIETDFTEYVSEN